MNKRILAYAVIILSVVYFYSSEARSNDVIATCDILIHETGKSDNPILDASIKIKANNPNRRNRFELPWSGTYCELTYWTKTHGTRLLCETNGFGNGVMSDRSWIAEKTKINRLEILQDNVDFIIFSECKDN